VKLLFPKAALLNSSTTPTFKSKDSILDETMINYSGKDLPKKQTMVGLTLAVQSLTLTVLSRNSLKPFS